MVSMINKKIYHSYIYERVVLQHLSWKSVKKSYDQDIALDSELGSLLDDIYMKFNWSFHKNAKTNIAKFRLWRKEFSLPENDTLVYAATYFVLYCCLVDKIIDSRCFSEDKKKLLCKELNSFWKITSESVCAFSEVALLGKRMKRLLFRKSLQNNFKWFQLLHKINRAFSSECFLYEHPLECFNTNIQLHNLTDKSICFVSSAFEIAALDSFNIRMEKLSEIIGNIFWLIDDICDFAADLEDGIINSALLFCTDLKQEMSIEHRINYALSNMEVMTQKLEAEIEEMNILASTELSNWILNQLWEWTADIRKSVEGNEFSFY